MVRELLVCRACGTIILASAQSHFTHLVRAGRAEAARRNSRGKIRQHLRLDRQEETLAHKGVNLDVST